MKDSLNDSALKQDELRKRAQMNEYMYAMLKDNGISVKMDEEIGIAFFDVENMAADPEFAGSSEK